MQIKQFTGATIDEVLTQVRAELGEEAVILQTKRVVKGGLGGFFGREGVEVTAAEGLPPGEGEAVNREAAASVAVPAIPATTGDDADDEFVPTAFRRHLESRLAAVEEIEAEAAQAASGPPASPAATYARAGAPPAPGDLERTQAILEAARAAVRDAHAQAVSSPMTDGDVIGPCRTAPGTWPARNRNGGAVQTTTGLSAPDAFASSATRSAGLTMLSPHGSVEDAVPAVFPAQAAEARARTTATIRRPGFDRIMPVV